MEGRHSFSKHSSQWSSLLAFSNFSTFNHSMSILQLSLPSFFYPLALWYYLYHIYIIDFFCSRMIGTSSGRETPTVEHPRKEGDHVEWGVQSRHHCQLMPQRKVCCCRHLRRKMYLLHYRGKHPVIDLYQIYEIWINAHMYLLIIFVMNILWLCVCLFGDIIIIISIVALNYTNVILASFHNYIMKWYNYFGAVG